MAVDYQTGATSAVGMAQTQVPSTGNITGTAAILGGGNAVMGSFYGRSPSATKMGTLATWGKKLAKVSPGAIIGGAIAAPAAYAADQATDKYKSDRKFHTGHFTEQMVPAAATAYLTAGITSNIMTEAGKTGGSGGIKGAARFAKNTLTPSAIHSGFKREIDNVKKPFLSMKGVKGVSRASLLARGALGAIFLGADFIAPGSYLAKLKNGTSSRENKKRKVNDKNS